MRLDLSAIAHHRALAAHAGALGGGFLRIYDLTLPSSPDAAMTLQQHLATLDFGDVQLHDGQITAELRDGIALANGRATWARIFDNEGAAFADLDVGEEGSGAAITLNTTDFRKGGPVTIRSFSMGIGR